MVLMQSLFLGTAAVPDLFWIYLCIALILLIVLYGPKALSWLLIQYQDFFRKKTSDDILDMQMPEEESTTEM